MAHQCPVCHKDFEELFIVPTNSMEPFTSVDAMKGVKAYGIYDAPKAILCHSDAYVHFAFLKDAEVQPPDTPEGKVWMVPGEERLVKMERFDQQTLADAHEYHCQNPQRCGHIENEIQCNNNGIPCYYEWSNDAPDGWYCTDHAHDEGFCPSCGLFNAGFESFDFSKSGLCEACQREIDDELDADDDEFDPDDDGMYGMDTFDEEDEFEQ